MRREERERRKRGIERRSPPLVGLFFPTWDGKLRAELHDAILDAALRNLMGADRYLLAQLGRRSHAPIDQARESFCENLAAAGGKLDLCVQIDSDELPESLVEGRSWLDLVVRAWLTDRDAIHVGAVPLGWQKPDAETSFARREDGMLLNYRRGSTGELERAGGGLLAIPSSAWARLLSRWPHPFRNDPGEPYRGEDVLLSCRARELGIRLALIPGLRISHWPEWRDPLVHEEPAC